MYKVLLYSVIHFSGTNTTTYITGFKLHCFFHGVNNRVLLHICPCSAGADELGDRQTETALIPLTHCNFLCL